MSLFNLNNIIKRYFVCIILSLWYLTNTASVSNSEYTIVGDYSPQSSEYPSTLWTLEDFVSRHNVMQRPTEAGRGKHTFEEGATNIDGSKRADNVLEESINRRKSEVYSRGDIWEDRRNKVSHHSEDAFDKLGVYIVEADIRHNRRETEIGGTTLFDKIIDHLSYLQAYINEYNGIKFFGDSKYVQLKESSVINDGRIDSVTNHIVQDMKSGIGYVRNMFEDVFSEADKILNRQSESLLKKRHILEPSKYSELLEYKVDGIKGLDNFQEGVTESEEGATFENGKNSQGANMIVDKTLKEVNTKQVNRTTKNEHNSILKVSRYFTDTTSSTGSNTTVRGATADGTELTTSSHLGKGREEYLAAAEGDGMDCSSQVNKCRDRIPKGDSNDLEVERKLKHKKFMKKFLVPLLIAYKLKFFALAPVLIAGLILLVGSTGLAGFFFALFAAVVSIKQHHPAH